MYASDGLRFEKFLHEKNFATFSSSPFVQSPLTKIDENSEDTIYRSRILLVIVSF